MIGHDLFPITRHDSHRFPFIHSLQKFDIAPLEVQLRGAVSPTTAINVSTVIRLRSHARGAIRQVYTRVERFSLLLPSLPLYSPENMLLWCRKMFWITYCFPNCKSNSRLNSGATISRGNLLQHIVSCIKVLKVILTITLEVLNALHIDRELVWIDRPNNLEPLSFYKSN